MDKTTLMKYKHVPIHLIDRSDPNEKIVYDPKRPVGHRDITRLEELKAGRFLRADIVLVNFTIPCPKCHRTSCCAAQWIQKVAYASMDGPVGEAVEYMSPEEIAEAKKLSDKIVEAAKTVPEMKYFLHTRY